MPGSEGVVDRVLNRLDAAQQRVGSIALVVSVVKRYSEDRAGRQAALVTFYGFLSLFPLFLLLATVAELILGESALHRDVVDSALAQFPVIGDKLTGNVRALARGNTTAVVVAALGLAWGSLGVTNSLQAASATVWRRPRSEDPDLWRRLRTGLVLLGVLAATTVASTLVAGAATNGVSRVGVGSAGGRVAAFAVVLACNLAGYLAALRLLAPRGTAWRLVAPGAALGAVGWSVLQVTGGWLVGHRLQHADQLYGLFAIVLGLIFWINLGAQLFLYATELNCVVADRSWPRSFRGGRARA